MDEAAGWIAEHGVREVECLIPDMNGVLRGKVLPAEKFLKTIDGGALYMPTSALLVCSDGRYSGSIDEGFAYGDPDMLLGSGSGFSMPLSGQQATARFHPRGCILSGGPSVGARCRARC